MIKPEPELRRILTFLAIEIDDEALKCAISKQGLFKRSKNEDLENIFTKKMVINLERKWQRINDMIEYRLFH